MTVLDACAVIAILREEPAADDVQALLETGAAQLTPVGLIEVVDVMVRIHEADEDELVADLGSLELIAPPPLAHDLALAAGRLRARHYHRVRRPVSLADCVAAETARKEGPLATTDPALLDLCAEEGIPYVALPGSTGLRHIPS